jgi:hypothetical protein
MRSPSAAFCYSKNLSLCAVRRLPKEVCEHTFARAGEAAFPSFMTSTLQKVVVAHSPDADDAFMFYGLATGKVRSPLVQFEHHLMWPTATS